MVNGDTARSTSADTATSMRMLLNAMQVLLLRFAISVVQT